jgi:hypothetical protein
MAQQPCESWKAELLGELWVMLAIAKSMETVWRSEGTHWMHIP